MKEHRLLGNRPAGACTLSRAAVGIAAIAAVLGLVATGCAKRVKAVPVSGRVTFQGKPLADVAVNFSPMNGSQEDAFAAYGKTDSDGRYTLKLADNDQAGATAGPNRVTFHESTGAAESDGPAPMTPLKLPPTARDGTMTYEVPAEGTAKADFEF